MSLERAIDEWVEVMGEASSISSLKDAKEISKRAEAICKSLQKVKEVDSSQARYILERIKKIDAEPPLVKKTTFREKILIQRELRSARSLLFKEKYLGGIMDKNWEAFMDADAQIVCRDLGIPAPLEKDVLRFKIKLGGQPIPESWDFSHELTGEKIENVNLGRLDYEGMAKLSQSLLYVDWIRTSRKESDFMLGPPFAHHPPTAIPLSIIAKVDASSLPWHYDFDFVVSIPTDIDATIKREYRSYLDIHTPTEKENRSYHPLPGFLFRAKIGRAKGVSKDDQEIMKEQVIERMKQNILESPIDIGWKLGVFLFYAASFDQPDFPPAGRGVLTPHGEDASSQYTVDLMPISEEEYKQGVLNRFEEDGIYHSEETIGNFPVNWGATYFHVRGGSIRLSPLTPGRLKTIQNPDYNAFCVGVLGFSDYVDKKLVKEFSKSVEKFAKSMCPKNHKLVVYPVLMTNSSDSKAREWAENTRHPIFGAIVELNRGKVHFKRESIWTAQYELAKPFFLRYFLSEEMRLVEREDYVEPRIPVKCLNCGTTYTYRKSEVESGSANCQNCGKQIDAKLVSSLPETEGSSQHKEDDDSHGY
jgi:DNA-directed RNA polymerase subunit RPC12/RpoP